MPKVPKPPKGKKKKIITAVVVVVLLILAGAAGVLLQQLQHKSAPTAKSGNSGGPTSALQNPLPQSVQDAQNLAATGNYDQANKQIASSIAATNDSTEKYQLYFQQGVNDENQGKYADAISAYKQAEALNQGWSIYAALGRASQENGNKADALTYYKKALSLIPNQPLNLIDRNEIQATITELGG